MSPRAYIVPRVTKGGKSYHVRYKPRNATTPIHWGAYPTKKLAERARDYVNGELAVGRYPDPHAIEAPNVARTVLQVLDEWTGSFPTRGASLVKLHNQARSALDGIGFLGRIDITRATTGDIQAWLNALDRKYRPATTRKYLEPIRAAFTYAGIEPNPAKDPRLRLPAQTDVDAEPPSWESFQLICAAITPAHLTTLLFLERHGLRIQELAQLQWGDIDLPGRRLRIASARSKSRTGGRRFVPLLAGWPEHLDAMVALEDRLHDRLVFPDFNENTFRGALTRACKTAGVGHYSPHDLRHRYISLLLLSRVDVVLAAKIAGHRRQSITIDTYGHVLLDEPQWRLDELRVGVSWVSGLIDPQPLGTENPVIPGFPRGVEDNGARSNPRPRVELARLALIHERLLAKAAAKPRTPRHAPPRPSPVLKAVTRVLEQAGQPMRARDIHAAAEHLAGEPLRWTSVKAALAAGTASRTPRFQRIRHGIYQGAREQRPSGIEDGSLE